jgi:hypothetical protein
MSSLFITAGVVAPIMLGITGALVFFVGYLSDRPKQPGPAE